MEPEAKTRELLKSVAATYGLDQLQPILADDDASLYKKDIFICLKNVVAAGEKEGDVLENLKAATNVYNGPLFGVGQEFKINAAPDFEAAAAALKNYQFCFKLNPYAIINTYLAIILAQVTGYDLDELIEKGIAHIEGSIEDALKNNPNWNKDSLTTANPVLVIPIGAAGCGKSTFYKELSNVVNISCDNVRYLLFSDLGPCFSAWESGLAWWVVNYLTDYYLNKGYSVFYNGVNTDMEYRSPVTMEVKDPLFAGIPYNIKLVYFDPPVALSDTELEELKGVNLWPPNKIEDVDRGKLSPNVAGILDLIKINYQRTLDRTAEISAGKAEQDPYDILYSVPIFIVKLFMEQSFARPSGDNVVEVPRKEIPDAAERAAFYRSYAQQVQG